MFGMPTEQGMQRYKEGKQVQPFGTSMSTSMNADMMAAKLRKLLDDYPLERGYIMQTLSPYLQGEQDFNLDVLVEELRKKLDARQTTQASKRAATSMGMGSGYRADAAVGFEQRSGEEMF